jgi:hypothetical protein
MKIKALRYRHGKRSVGRGLPMVIVGQHPLDHNLITLTAFVLSPDLNRIK